MKYAVALVFFIFLISTVFSLSGAGSESNPFVIATCEDLLKINNAPDKDYIITKDIDCFADTHEGGALWNDGHGFNTLNEFSGSLRGVGTDINGKRQIYGLYIKDYWEGGSGLFSITKGALIENISLVDLNLIGSTNVGGLVGTAYFTTIRNCDVHGHIEADDDSVGGVVGFAGYSEFFDVNNFATISALNASTYVSWTGGIIGYMRGSIIKVAGNYGSISAMNEIGGIAGRMEASIIIGAVNYGDIPEGRSQIGGIAGGVIKYDNSYSRITYSRNYASLYPQSIVVDDSPYQSHYPKSLGGLVGEASGLILGNSYNFGSLTGGFDVAGIVGKIGEGSITTCDNDGNLLAVGTGTQAAYGGVAGIANSSLWKSVNICDTTNYGIVARSGTTIKVCTFLNTCQFLHQCSGGYTDCLLGTPIGEYEDGTYDGYTSDVATCHGETFIEVGWSCPNNIPTAPNSVCSSKGYFSCMNYQCGTVKTHSKLFSKCYGPVYGDEYFDNFYDSRYSDTASSDGTYSNWVSDFFSGYSQAVFSTVSTNAVCENKCYDSKSVYYTDSGIPFCDYPDEFKCEPSLGGFSLYSDSMQLVPGDDTELNKNTTATLVDTPSSEKCEYRCKPGYVRVGDSLTGDCIIPKYACTGSIDTNAVIYEGDNIGLTENLPAVLVSANTSKKCEYHCKDGYYKGTGLDENKCFPYYCLDNSSILLDFWTVSCGRTANEVALDKNYMTSLVSSCSPLNYCEYTCNSIYGNTKIRKVDGIRQCVLSYCGDGFCDDGENVASCYADCHDCIKDGFCNPNCISVVDPDCAPCTENYFSCTSDANCCSGICSQGTCKTAFSCVGDIDSNAWLYEGDDSNLTADTNKILVSENTAAKCEYYCRPGFERGDGTDGNKCLLISGYYQCLPHPDGNAILYPGDNTILTVFDSNTPVLSASDTSRKCEYYCNPAFDLLMKNNRCVTSNANAASCGNAARLYYILDDGSVEEFPGIDSFCINGVLDRSESDIILGNAIGNTASWRCINTDGNAECSALRGNPVLFDINAVLDLNAEYNPVKGSVDAWILCSKNLVADVKVVDGGGNVLSTQVKQVPCKPSFSKVSIGIDGNVLKKGVYSLNASIKNTTSECSICSRTDFFLVKSDEKAIVPDNSILLLGLILTIVFLIIDQKKQ